MNLCRENCPVDNSKTCCFFCPQVKTCPQRCKSKIEEHEVCENAEEVRIDSDTQMTRLVNQYMDTFKAVAEMERVKADIEAKEKAMKETLKAAMEKYGVKALDAGFMKIDYINPTVTHGIDSAKLKKKYPAIAAECSKESPKAGYIKITLKEGE